MCLFSNCFYIQKLPLPPHTMKCHIYFLSISQLKIFFTFIYFIIFFYWLSLCDLHLGNKPWGGMITALSENRVKWKLWLGKEVGVWLELNWLGESGRKGLQESSRAVLEISCEKDKVGLSGQRAHYGCCMATQGPIQGRTLDLVRGKPSTWSYRDQLTLKPMELYYICCISWDSNYGQSHLKILARSVNPERWFWEHRKIVLECVLTYKYFKNLMSDHNRNLSKVKNLPYLLHHSNLL